MLDQVITGAERARDLVKQILSFSRPADPDQKVVRLTPVVSEVMQLMRATLPTTIEIRQEFRAVSDIVKANPTQLHQVLVNLCTNAWHALDGHQGVLKVTLEDVGLQKEFLDRHPEASHDRYVLLSVADTGCGMEPEVLDRIFEPFFTTKEVGQGTGLGLAAVHGIVEGLGGTIEVESMPGKGTTFRIYVPSSDASEALPQESRRPGTNRGEERILFVDDEEAIVELGQQALENLGYSVVTTTSGEHALDLFRSDPTSYDLVITDQTMPGLTGISLAEELLRERPGLPIILCTGYSRSVTPAKAKEAGIKEFVAKPTTITELSDAVRRALGEGAV